MKLSLKVNKISYSPYYNNFSFEVGEGELVAISGDKGCGKSTLLSILAGIIPPDEGSITYGGKSIEMSSCNIGYLYNENHYSYVCSDSPLMYGKKFDYNYVIINHIIDTYGYMYYASKRDNSIPFVINSILRFPDIILLDEPYQDRGDDFIVSFCLEL